MTTCLCRQPTVTRVVKKEGPNQGRTFEVCSKPRGKQCDFFVWSDTTRTQHLCDCGGTCPERTVRDPENKNYGKRYAACAAHKATRCRYFKWLEPYYSTRFATELTQSA